MKKTSYREQSKEKIQFKYISGNMAHKVHERQTERHRQRYNKKQRK